ncbi:hypothetical protein BT96DRAFT_948594 [Gymnopus androsaceus JB14]|uniref:Uncharacterized protein n=1 Tax=Gymnopus androsaceus JB14 TaxID=1447944 RepID=A0A6A4GN13_9AGAR|nr:hypothetical protein BT96DRAFT_948594 [Gymnopus androsaceus JB14]
MALTIPDGDLALFKERLSDDLWAEILYTPRPQSWSLVSSERVEVIGYTGIADRATGVIQSTGTKLCHVLLDEYDAEYSIPYIYLRKVLRNGDIVGVPQNIAGLRQLKQTVIPESGLAHTEVEQVVVQNADDGFVVKVSTDTVDVYLREFERSVTLHRNTVRFISASNSVSYASQMSLLPKELPTPVRWRDRFGIVNESALQVASSVANHAEFGNQMFTGETPYKGLNVLVQGSNALRGQRATILSMRADPSIKVAWCKAWPPKTLNTTTMISVELIIIDSFTILPQLPGCHEPIIWLPPGINSYYNFKLGYVPTYTLREKREFGFIPTVEPVMGPPLPPSEPHEPSPLPSIDGIPGSTPAWMREEHDELRLGGVAWNSSSSGCWFANAQLRVSLAGKDVKIATIRGIDEQVQIYTADGGVVIREVSMAFNKREYGRNLDPSEISTERCTWDVGDLRSSQYLFVVARGPYLGCKQTAAHDSNDYDFVVHAISLTKDKNCTSNTWIETFDDSQKAVFYVDRKNLLVIAITDKQQKQGRNLVKGLQALDYSQLLSTMRSNESESLNALAWPKAAMTGKTKKKPSKPKVKTCSSVKTGPRWVKTTRITRSNKTAVLMPLLSEAQRQQEMKAGRKRKIDVEVVDVEADEQEQEQDAIGLDVQSSMVSDSAS